MSEKRLIPAYDENPQSGPILDYGTMSPKSSPLHGYDEFVPPLDVETHYEIDMQQIYTGGIFRTSKGGSRAQMIADPATGLNAFQIYKDDVLVMELSDGAINFIDPATGGTGSIVMNGDDLDIISTDGNINLIPDSAGGHAVNVASNLLPAIASTYDIGSITFPWRDGVFDGDVAIGGFMAANNIFIVDGVTPPGTVLGFASIYIDTADGDLKIKFGDGTVKTIVTD